MYGDNFIGVSAEEGKRRWFSGFGRQQRIEHNKAVVRAQYQRYETIKTKYGWLGKKWPFVMQDDYCVIGDCGWRYDERGLDSAVEAFVDRCEDKAKRHQKKRLKQEKRRALHANLYGELERRVLELGGVFKYHKNGVSITLPVPDKIGKVKDFFLEYNDYDKTFLEEKVVILERAHQDRLDFISGGSSGSESSHT